MPHARTFVKRLPAWQSRAAELLGLSRGALYRKRAEYGLEQDTEDAKSNSAA